MWRTFIVLLLGCLGAGSAWGEERLVKHEVPSKFLRAPRTVRVYLPKSYFADTKSRFPLLYLHDGQNVFSSAGTNVCFGWGNWELDKTVDKLSQEGRMRPIILVAVDHSAARYTEYCGGHRQSESENATDFENYTAFLTKELKPWIDANYRTRTDPANTGVMGSSMGGICSVILAWDHPEIFGLAASLSGAFQVEKTNFLRQVLRPYQGGPKTTRIYLDSGVVDFTGGDDGKSVTAGVADEFGRLGWGKSLLHYVDAKPLTPAELEQAGLRRDKWSEAQTSQHNEFYWRLRAWRSLTFLFPPEAGQPN